MDAIRAAEILQSLLNGVDPATGERFPREHVCNDPDVIRALHHAIAALGGCPARPEASEPAARREEPAPAPYEPVYYEPAFPEAAEAPDRRADAQDPGLENVGKPWSVQDEAMAVEMYQGGEAIGDIAAHFRRSVGAIRARMVRLGLAADRENVPEVIDRDAVPVEDSALRRRAARGDTPAQIAAALDMAENAVLARLYALDLYDGE